MDKDCQIKTASELRKASHLIDDVSDEDILGLWGHYWAIESEGFDTTGPCHCELVDNFQCHKYPEKSLKRRVDDFVRWATMSPLQLRQI